jgi:hypothetical protein
LQKDPRYTKFLYEGGDDVADDIFTYTQTLDFLKRYNLCIASNTEKLYRFRRISAHQVPLRTSDMDYKGSTYNALIEW